jgi:hypothetical protein
MFGTGVTSLSHDNVSNFLSNFTNHLSISTPDPTRASKAKTTAWH